jgi:hypothetical protein
MPRNKRPPPTAGQLVQKLVPSRWHQRLLATFDRQMRIGRRVNRAPAGSRASEVERLADKYGVHERFVWGAGALERKISAPVLARWESRASGKSGKRRFPLSMARIFLVTQLRSGPLPAKEIEALARKVGISSRTLQRAAKRRCLVQYGLDVILDEPFIIKRHVGGSHGHWVWELSAAVKKIYTVDD